MSNEIMIAKLATQFVAGMGVSKILGDIVTRNVMVVTTLEKVTVKAGTFVLGSMLVEQSTNHVSQQVDSLVNWYQSRKAQDTASI